MGRLVKGARIIGVDEVGRGCWAGPVIAAAVILPADFWERAPDIILKDSKQMNAKAREISAAAIKTHAQYAIGAASVREIDRFNIRQATHLAMTRAVFSLSSEWDRLDIDGRDIPQALNHNAHAIIKGDRTHHHIAAASIVAKCFRDALMRKLARLYPEYAWENNAGYGTKAHQSGLDAKGVTPHHRVSFKPIHTLLRS